MLRLKKGRERCLTHPWVFKGDVGDVSDVAPGDEVRVIDAAGRFVGRGLYNPRPSLCCRIVTRRDETLDAAFFGARIAEAVARRSPGGVPAALARLVWSEGDGLPGLVVDRYGPALVLQCTTLGMARRRDALVAALRAVLGPRPVFLADEAVPAQMEGFSPARGWYDAPGPASVIVDEGGVRLAVTLGRGHKTGLYLDQRENRRRVGALAHGRDVLDAFAYTGGFACHALVAGARRAVCIESSPEAVAAAGENFALNGVDGRAQVLTGNAFDELRRLAREPERFGLIVLDPPPFARGRTALPAALRGYKDVNLRAMRLLAPGGLLATFSCSHHVDEAGFAEVCRDGAADAGVTLRVRAILGQASDHPVILGVPETKYLKGLLLEAV